MGNPYVFPSARGLRIPKPRPTKLKPINKVWPLPSVPASELTRCTFVNVI